MSVSGTSGKGEDSFGDLPSAPSAPSFTQSLQLALSAVPETKISEENKFVHAFTIFEMHRRLTQPDNEAFAGTPYFLDCVDVSPK
ncbi:MAG: hypothetical protein CMM87_07160 [Rickettsiales bacterium]|nr:hypothetical protein [Rickettsiales bacterium]|tara:strand:- start:6645 stop:6899 length:255 start_codon:yes stop_codon:yes gene_type:complete